MVKQTVVPALKEYQSYRKFLLDWYLYRKQLRPGFSYRRFSQLLGLKSPNFLQLVISGQRNLSEDLAKKIAHIIHLSKSERAYFISLVQLDSAKSHREKEQAEKARRVALRKLLTTPMTKTQEKIFSNWHHMLVRELVFLKDFESSGEYISKKLSGLISPQEAERSLALLLQSGFLIRDENGKLKAADPVIDSGDTTFTHEFMQKHHGETLITWGKNLSSLNTKEQELGLLHIPIHTDKIPELRKRIRRFQDEIIGWLESERDADRVVQLGTYLIPYHSEEAHSEPK